MFERINTIGDGSCLLHAILGCCNELYNSLSNNEKIKLVREFRDDLSEVLDYKLEGKKIYDKLSRGQLKEISKHIKEVDKEFMKDELKGNGFLDMKYLELISDLLNINIIIIDNLKKKIYETGDKDIFFKKNRNTIFINYIQDTHFESLRYNGKTIFKTFS